MIAGAAFDLYRPLFTPSKLAELSGVKRPVIDTMGTRGFIRASGREQPATPRRLPKKKGRRGRGSRGRPLFSARDAFKVRLMRVLAAQLDAGLGQAGLFGEKIDDADERITRRMAEYDAAAVARLATIADAPATEGEWMWAMARSIEREEPFYIYAYAVRLGGEWEFDMHVENSGTEKPTEPPCFGWDVPHIYVPIGEIFIAVYNDCKKLLGLTLDGGP
jgi:hypothetical protein